MSADQELFKRLFNQDQPEKPHELWRVLEPYRKKGFTKTNNNQFMQLTAQELYAVLHYDQSSAVILKTLSIEQLEEIFIAAIDRADKNIIDILRHFNYLESDEAFLRVFEKAIRDYVTQHKAWQGRRRDLNHDFNNISHLNNKLSLLNHDRLSEPYLHKLFESLLTTVDVEDLVLFTSAPHLSMFNLSRIEFAVGLTPPEIAFYWESLWLHDQNPLKKQLSSLHELRNNIASSSEAFLALSETIVRRAIKNKDVNLLARFYFTSQEQDEEEATGKNALKLSTKNALSIFKQALNTNDEHIIEDVFYLTPDNMSNEVANALIKKMRDRKTPQALLPKLFLCLLALNTQDMTQATAIAAIKTLHKIENQFAPDMQENVLTYVKPLLETLPHVLSLVHSKNPHIRAKGIALEKLLMNKAHKLYNNALNNNDDRLELVKFKSDLQKAYDEAYAAMPRSKSYKHLVEALATIASILFPIYGIVNLYRAGVQYKNTGRWRLFDASSEQQQLNKAGKALGLNTKDLPGLEDAIQLYDSLDHHLELTQETAIDALEKALKTNNAQYIIEVFDKSREEDADLVKTNDCMFKKIMDSRTPKSLLPDLLYNVFVISPDQNVRDISFWKKTLKAYQKIEERFDFSKLVQPHFSVYMKAMPHVLPLLGSKNPTVREHGGAIESILYQAAMARLVEYTDKDPEDGDIIAQYKRELQTAYDAAYAALPRTRKNKLYFEALATVASIVFPIYGLVNLYRAGTQYKETGRWRLFDASSEQLQLNKAGKALGLKTKQLPDLEKDEPKKGGPKAQ